MHVATHFKLQKTLTASIIIFFNQTNQFGTLQIILIYSSRNKLLLLDWEMTEAFF